MFLKISQYSQETPALESFLEFLYPMKVFSCEYCKILKNSFFGTTPLVAALENAEISDLATKSH